MNEEEFVLKSNIMKKIRESKEKYLGRKIQNQYGEQSHILIFSRNFDIYTESKLHVSIQRRKIIYSNFITTSLTFLNLQINGDVTSWH